MIDRRHTEFNGTADGFTLVELLVAMAIIGLLAATVLVGMAGVTESSRADRTRAQIARIHTLIAQKWESFEDVRVNVSAFAGKQSRQESPDRRSIRSVLQARHVVDAKRELMRMTLPDRKADVVDGLYVVEQGVREAWPRGPAVYAGLTNPPSEWHAYRRKAKRFVGQHKSKPWMNEDGWTRDFEDAECLYLILGQMTDGDRAALEFFRDDEIGDIDNDGMPEIHDAWGTPIRFLRWAPGFNVAAEYREKISGWQLAESQTYSSIVIGGFQNVETPDPFDPLELYTRYPYQINDYRSDASRVHRTFALFPLIISAGGDKNLDMRFDLGNGPVHYVATTPPNNPYVNTFGYAGTNSTPYAIGIRGDTNQNGRDDFADNIHNHLITTGR